MNSLPVSPTLVSVAQRCLFAAALKRRGAPSHHGKGFVSLVGEGTHFEASLTGEAPPEEDTLYTMWLGSATKPNKERIERMADYVADKLFDFSDPGISLQRRIDVPMDAYRLGPMFADYIGPMDGWADRGIVDFKFTKSIVEWRRSPFDGFDYRKLQLPMYAMGLLLEDEQVRSRFLEICTVPADVQNQGGPALDRFKEQAMKSLSEEMPKLLPMRYILVQNQGDKVVIKNGKEEIQPPLVNIQDVSVEVADLYLLHRILVKLSLNIQTFMVVGDTYSRAIEHQLLPQNDDPNYPEGEYRCLGKRSDLMGECPYLRSCIYGKKFVEETGVIDAGGILNLMEAYAK